MPGSKPKFNKELPKNWAWFFNPASDDLFKKKHPVWYVILVSIALVVIVAPMSLFIYLSVVLAPNVNSPILILGMIGAFSISVGLFNIVAAYLHQYLGHKVTVVSLMAGIITCTIVLLIMIQMN